MCCVPGVNALPFSLINFFHSSQSDDWLDDTHDQSRLCRRSSPFFPPTCILAAYFFLSFEPTGLERHFWSPSLELLFFLLFFVVLSFFTTGVSGVQNGLILIPRPGVGRSNQTCLLPLCLVPVILSEGPISFGFCFHWLSSHFRLVISCYSPIFPSCRSDRPWLLRLCVFSIRVVKPLTFSLAHGMLGLWVKDGMIKYPIWAFSQ